jgi:hypothetical protein
VAVRRWVIKALKLLLAGSLLFFASGPARGEDAPAYVNAEVVRYDKSARALVFRASGGEEKLVVDAAIVSAVSQLRSGDKVILTTRVTGANDKGAVRVVTEVRPASGTSGEPGKTTSHVAPIAGTVTTPVTTPTTTTGPRTAVITPSAPPNPAGGIPVSSIRGIPSLPYPSPKPVTVVVAGPTPSSVTPEQAALLEFQAAAAAKSLEAAEIDLSWAAFRQTCLKEGGPPTSGRRDWFRLFSGDILPQGDEACRRALDELKTRADDFKSDLATISQAARRGGVLPGQIREVLQANNMDF